MAKLSIYTVGGTIQISSKLYITRQADQILLDLCRAGAFAYVLTSRQMGKSSLMVSTAARLAEENIASAIVDLTKIGVQATTEEWYLSLLTEIEEGLGLKTDVIDWWLERNNLTIAQRLTTFFEKVLLAEVKSHVVIFIDEIDTTLSLTELFTDDFYAAIRYLYNARAFVSELERLSFVLIGVATPSDLINDPDRTPFNIGHRVDLTDFTFEEAQPLAQGWNLRPEKAHQVLEWVLKRTGGHPYLTQRLCRVIADCEQNSWSKTDVDNLVADTFLGEMSEKDHNLRFVRDMLTKRAADPGGVLATYRQIRYGWFPVYDEEQSLVKSHLKLSGIVCSEENILRVRNPIYAEVFNRQWIKEHWSVNWLTTMPTSVKVSAGFVTILLLALTLLTIYAAGTQRQLAQQRQEAATTVKTWAQAESIALTEAETERNQAKQQAHLALSPIGYAGSYTLE